MTDPSVGQRQTSIKLGHDPKLVEAVARAICRATHKEQDRNITDEALAAVVESCWWEWKPEATAALDAIAAMGRVVVPVEMTEAMRRAGWAEHTAVVSASMSDVTEAVVQQVVDKRMSDPVQADLDRAAYRAALQARPGATP